MKRSKKFRLLNRVQAASFIAVLVCGTGESNANIIGLAISITALAAVTFWKNSLCVKSA